MALIITLMIKGISLYHTAEVEESYNTSTSSQISSWLAGNLFHFLKGTL